MPQLDIIAYILVLKIILFVLVGFYVLSSYCILPLLLRNIYVKNRISTYDTLLCRLFLSADILLLRETRININVTPLLRSSVWLNSAVVFCGFVRIALKVFLQCSSFLWAQHVCKYLKFISLIMYNDS